MQNSDARHATAPRTTDDSAGVQADHPFREYISAMARQLAQLARSEGDGDEVLANVLEQAAMLATGPRDEGLTATPIHQATGAHAQPG
ncbi:MAG: hypothetical protein V7672_14920 [Brevundimonas sp.]|jgi:hypothetical protein|uniref:hypothetical protein n=1 Tax=Brevundimonas sp. TaxID=1871086 RepID=UPI0030022A67